jgi:mannose-6-phosphate isomerase-like protein (cupin superfamily)
MFPTLPTLLRIALVFSVGLDFFFADVREKPLLAITRRSERVTLPDRPGSRGAAYRFASLDYPATERRFSSYYAEFLPVAADAIRPHDHPGVEFIYVLQGTLRVQVDGQDHALHAGDSMYFDSSRPHAYSRAGARSCSALVVTAASA